MQKINNIKLKKYSIPLILSCLGFSGAFLFSYLTFIPRQTFAVTMLDPTEMRTLSSIEYMQNMTQQICINSREHETKQLKDNRDGKSYWVTKLKDGNCWMAQNLDFVPKSGITLTAFGSWPVTGASIIYGEGGDYVYTRKDATQDSCGADAKSLEDCENRDKGWANVEDKTASSDPDFTKTNNGNVVGDTEYDAHYHAGNYYSYNAATISQSVDGQALNSICPADWELPTSSTTNNSVSGSFYYLLNEYGLIGTLKGTDSVDIRTAPLYFFYGGYVGGSALRFASSYGYYWSSTPNGSDSAYSLGVYSGVNPSNSDYRYLGMSVRCLAMGGWLDSYPDPNDQSSVAITVAPVITLEVTKDATNEGENIDFTEVAVDTIEVRVGSNLGYKVLISTPEDKVNLLKQPEANQPEASVIEDTSNVPFIPMIKVDSTILPRTKAWGIKKLGTNANDIEVSKDTIYSPVGIGDKAEVFYTSETAASTTLVFPVAIAVDSTTPFGTYSTQVTLTAVVN